MHGCMAVSKFQSETGVPRAEDNERENHLSPIASRRHCLPEIRVRVGTDMPMSVRAQLMNMLRQPAET